MFALEIINALNDPDNSAKPKGLNAKLTGHRPTQGERLCLGRGALEDCQDCTETNEQASEALDRREERNISHYSGGRFRY